MEEFGGECKRNPDYIAELGFKCFGNHNLCRY
jgi:hypothetical protein